MESSSGCLPNRARHTTGRTFMPTTRIRWVIDDIERIGGELQKARERLVQAWAELHRGDSWRTGAGCKPANGRSGSRRFAS